MQRTAKLQKEEKHELLYRQGFYLPPISSAAVTHDYLDGVKDGTFFCPKFPVKMMGCYRPPTNAILAEELMKAQKELNLNFGFKDAKKLPKDYLLHLLANLSNDHEFFAPGYYPDRAKKNVDIADVGFKMRFKQEKLNASTRDAKIQDLKRSLRSWRR